MSNLKDFNGKAKKLSPFGLSDHATIKVAAKIRPLSQEIYGLVIVSG